MKFQNGRDDRNIISLTYEAYRKVVGKHGIITIKWLMSTFDVKYQWKNHMKVEIWNLQMEIRGDTPKLSKGTGLL